MLCTLSLAWIDGNSAWVEPWHASHLRPPWPVEKRYSERPGSGRVGVVAKVALTACRDVPGASKTDV